MMNDQKYLEKDFAVYCLTQYYQRNKTDLALALAELKQSDKKPVEFLQQFLNRKNEDADAITARIAQWKKEYAARRRMSNILKKIRLPIVLIMLVLAGYFIWKNTSRTAEQTEDPNRDTLYVITTSGFRARETAAGGPGPRRFFQYGDTVTNLHDTVNGWMKFSHQDKILFGPSKYFVSEQQFRRYDSLFKDYHYNKPMEPVNSKAAFCVYDFIDRSLHASVRDWYIPLQPLMKNQANHAVLSLPEKVDYVTVEGEGKLEKYHLLLLSRRNIVSPDSVNHYVLLLELLPNGSVIKKEDFPLAIADETCYISIQNFDRFFRGIVNNNVYLRTADKKILKLAWVNTMEAPKWEWIE